MSCYAVQTDSSKVRSDAGAFWTMKLWIVLTFISAKISKLLVLGELITEKYLNCNKMERQSQCNSTEAHNLSSEVIFFARCGAELMWRIPNALLNERTVNLCKVMKINALFSTCEAQPVHLLWVLRFLKQYETWDVLACACGVSIMTVRKWFWCLIRTIAKIKLVSQP